MLSSGEWSVVGTHCQRSKRRKPKTSRNASEMGSTYLELLMKHLQLQVSPVCIVEVSKCFTKSSYPSHHIGE